MSGFELNRLIASILLSCLIAMLTATLVNIIYKPSNKSIGKGYEIVPTKQSKDYPNNKVDSIKEYDIKILMAKANANAGKKLIKKCISCHTLNIGGKARIGPNLYNVYNNKKGSKNDFSYSKGLINKGGIWDDKSLFYFIKKPKAYIKGTKMSFIGIKKHEDIVNIIAFLKELKN